MSKTVIDIIIEYLEKNGFDGLRSRDASCGCNMAHLGDCGTEGILSCEPGYQISCACGDGCEYHITIKKPS